MKHFWLLCFGPLLLQAADLPLIPPMEQGLSGNPKPFPPNHYDLLMEYSPFVKSADASKETEKSPELVVVGYGRIAGESHVIIQSKDNSEKREKIGSRFGSKAFPYRLLSVTNASDRKKFMAVLEDRNKRQLKIFYANEAAPTAPPSAGASLAASQALANNSPTNVVTRPPVGLSEGIGAQTNTPEGLQKAIQSLEASLSRPDLPEGIRKIQSAILEAKKRQLEALLNPQDIGVSAEPTP